VEISQGDEVVVVEGDVEAVEVAPEEDLEVVVEAEEGLEDVAGAAVVVDLEEVVVAVDLGVGVVEEEDLEGDGEEVVGGSEGEDAEKASPFTVCVIITLYFYIDKSLPLIYSINKTSTMICTFKHLHLNSIQLYLSAFTKYN